MVDRIDGDQFVVTVGDRSYRVQTRLHDATHAVAWTGQAPALAAVPALRTERISDGH